MILLQLLAAAAAACAVCSNPADARVFSGLTYGLFILLGSVFAPPEDAVPRLLVTRHWPRGIARGAVDQWEPRLGPPPEMLEAFTSGSIDRVAFGAAYRAELLLRPSLLDWAARMATNTGVALLCDSHDDDVCHRALLADLLRERILGS